MCSHSGVVSVGAGFTTYMGGVRRGQADRGVGCRVVRIGFDCDLCVRRVKSLVAVLIAWVGVKPGWTEGGVALWRDVVWVRM